VAQNAEVEPSVTLSALKQDPIAAVNAGGGAPVAVLSGSKTAFYCLPIDTYEAILERLDDKELALVIESRLSESCVRVDLDKL